MLEEIFPAPLYTFLKYANETRYERIILDCGVGGRFPKLALFSLYGYELFGIEISEVRLQWAEEFFIKNSINAEIRHGDMRDLPYESNKFSFVFSYNTIFHMSKKDIIKSINEILRVLKPGGLLYLNLLSLEDSLYGAGKEISPGRFRQFEDGEYIEHTFYEVNEGDEHFTNHKILYKQIRKENLLNSDHADGMVDYIVKKQL